MVSSARKSRDGPARSSADRGSGYHPYHWIGSVNLDGQTYTHSDLGRCMFTGDSPEALDMALAGCVTDCLKRCFRQIGEQFGLSLYDKEIAATAGTGPHILRPPWPNFTPERMAAPTEAAKSDRDAGSQGVKPKRLLNASIWTAARSTAMKASDLPSMPSSKQKGKLPKAAMLCANGCAPLNLQPRRFVNHPKDDQPQSTRNGAFIFSQGDTPCSTPSSLSAISVKIRR